MTTNGEFEDPNTEGRDEVMEHFEEVAHPWLTRARAAADRIIRTRGQATSDEVLEDVGLPPSDIHPNVVGAIFRTGYLRIGVTQSRRPKNNASIIGIWTMPHYTASPEVMRFWCNGKEYLFRGEYRTPRGGEYFLQGVGPTADRAIVYPQ